MVAMAEQGVYDIDVLSYIDYTAKDVLDGPWHSREYRDRYRVAGLKITRLGRGSCGPGRCFWRVSLDAE